MTLGFLVSTFSKILPVGRNNFNKNVQVKTISKETKPNFTKVLTKNSSHKNT